MIDIHDFQHNYDFLDSRRNGGVVWRIKASESKLVCAVGSRNGTEMTKLLVLDFDEESNKVEKRIDLNS